MLLSIFVLYSTLIAMASVCYISILSEEKILNWWFRFGLKFSEKWYYQIIWGCPLCNSGQIALWFYIYNWIFVQSFSGRFFDLVIFVAITILQSYFINYFKNKTEE